MEADRKKSRTQNVPRTVGWDGGPSETQWGIRYGADAEFPAYFDREQLYNLDADVFEQTNLVKDLRATEPLERMRLLLQKQMDLVGDR